MQFFFEKDDVNGLTDCLKYCNDNVISKTKKEIIFLCIGTDKIIGDSFGPIVGHYLSQNDYTVYGNLQRTVNGTNLKKYIQQIYINHNSPYIIVLDSALGEYDIVNKIVVGKGGIKPGSALNKNNKLIGDLYINAVVGINSNQNFEELKRVKLYNIISLSNTVFEAITKSIGLDNKKIDNNYISLERS